MAIFINFKIVEQKYMNIPPSPPPPQNRTEIIPYCSLYINDNAFISSHSTMYEVAKSLTPRIPLKCKGSWVARGKGGGQLELE